jgi:ATP-dependent Clp protease ATP-binding subunit ClpC
MKTRICAKTSQEAVELRRVAEELARRNGEPASTLHVLSAVALRSGAASDLLIERNVTTDRLMGEKVRTDPHGDSVERVFARASEVASLMNESAPTDVHVLVALLGEGNTAARRALVNSRVDIAHLRAAAMHVGLGWIGRRRLATKQSTHTGTKSAAKSHVPLGVTIPLFSAPAGRNPVKDPPLVGRDKRAQVVPLLPRPEKKQTQSTTRQPTTDSPAAASSSHSAAELPRAFTRRAKRPSPGDYTLDAQKFPTLATFGTNLCDKAARGLLDPVIGRAREMEHVLDVLAKRHGNNPVLVGPAGVGKTSVVRGLAQYIVDQQALLALDERVIVEISISELLAGTGVRGALAQRMIALHQEVRRAAGRVVVFFDEIHQLFSGDAGDEISGELKLALSRGDMPCIGATTFEEYRRTIEADAAMCRRFSVVEVEEPNQNDARLVLESAASKLGPHHRVVYAAEALDSCVKWSVRYLPGRLLPDKAVSVLDLAGARVRRRSGHTVTREAVAEVIATLADMPMERMTESDRQRFLALEQLIAERVVGHQTALQKIACILRRNAAGLGSKRPLGTFLLLGPTGVGKTETAKAVAEALFQSDTALTRLDMAEYTEAHAVARLIGAPPGYVGHDAGGQLTEAVRRRPYQVLLLDEIEKAHPDVLQSFLSVFDEGRMTDGRGRTVDFTNTIILMTSNLGSEHTAARPKRRVGFGAQDQLPTNEQTESEVIAAARARLSPELYNRIDEALVFEPLTRTEIREVARRLLTRTAGALKERQIELDADDACIDWLLDRGGYDISLGARPMKRTLARYIEAPLAEQILGGGLVAGMTARFGIKNGELELEAIS